MRMTEGLSSRVKESFLSTRGLKEIKDNLGDPYFEKIDPKARGNLITIRDVMRKAYFAIIAIYSVPSHVELCAKMINRYPWHGTGIRKSDHIEFVWHGFTNHCYIFEERASQLGGYLSKMTSLIGGESVNAGAWKKTIKKELFEHIKFRGMHVHEWPKSSERYQFFGQLDTLAEMDRKFAEYRNELYFITKKELRAEILETKKKMLKILENFDPDPIEVMLRYCRAFDALLEKHEI